MAKTDFLAIASPGARPLKSAKHEKYCRLRASALPRIRAYREVGWETRDDADAYSNACALERRPGVRERIAYLSRQAEELIAEKRQRLEEQLWNIHEADIGDCFETYEATKSDGDGKLATDAAGKMLKVRKQRPKLLSDLPSDLRKAIEHVQVDARGNVVPQLYSKAQANAELRKLLNIGRTEDRPESDVLSDAELIAQLSDQANQLGVKIDLSYSFDQAPPAASEPTEANGGGQVIDTVAQPDAQHGEEDRRAAEATREMTISARPPSSQRRQDAFAGSRKLRNRP